MILAFFCYSNLRWETGGFELASTITLVLQANRLTKCASHPKSHLVSKAIFFYHQIIKYCCNDWCTCWRGLRLLLHTEASIGSQHFTMPNKIKDLFPYFKKLEASVSILKNSSKKLVEQLHDNKQQCWANFHYSRCESRGWFTYFLLLNIALKDKVCYLFRAFEVESDRGICNSIISLKTIRNVKLRDWVKWGNLFKHCKKK